MSGKHERDYIERTIATVRNHRDADNCWPQWANIFADEIEECWAQLDALAEAQVKALAAIDAEIAKMCGFYEDCKEEGSYSEATSYGRKIDGLEFARAALAEAGL